MYTIEPFITNVKAPDVSYFCCCLATSSKNMEVNILYPYPLERDDVICKLQSENDSNTILFRILGFILHFGGIYLIFYPLILLIGMIPFIGAIGAVVLIFFAFILALISFTFILSCAWMCARPLLGGCLLILVLLFIYSGKTSRDYYLSKQENQNDDNYQIEHIKNRILKKFL